MKPDLPTQVFAYIRKQQLLQPGERLLVAVSGGPDSTALLHLLVAWSRKQPLTLGVAHFNHRLRGAAAEEDAAFVAELARRYQLPFFLGAGEVKEAARASKTSVQAAARKLRLAFLHEVQQKEGYQKIALGHTADDQLELFFLRLLRGAGPEGLRGMRPAGPLGLIRPLLASTKAEILAWLQERHYSFRLDASNLEAHYLRNRLRLEILPRLLDLNPRLRQTIAHLQAVLGAWDLYLEEQAAAWQPSWRPCPDGWEVPLAAIPWGQKVLAARVARRLLAAAGVPVERLSGRHYAALASLGDQRRGQLRLPGGWELSCRGPNLILRPVPAPKPTSALPPQLLPATESGCLPLGPWRLAWQVLPPEDLPKTFPPDPCQAWLDLGRLTLPLVVRGWQPGDRFQPLGMAHFKKLQDFFVDAKIPPPLRRLIPLVLSGAEIVWVAGYRMAESVKVTPATRRVLHLRLWQAEVNPA